jgi:hypothetical protein
MQDDPDAGAVESQAISRVAARMDEWQQMPGCSSVTKGHQGTHETHQEDQNVERASPRKRTGGGGQLSINERQPAGTKSKITPVMEEKEEAK